MIKIQVVLFMEAWSETFKNFYRLILLVLKGARPKD